jgi:hypothetical protein
MGTPGGRQTGHRCIKRAPSHVHSIPRITFIQWFAVVLTKRRVFGLEMLARDWDMEGVAPLQGLECLWGSLTWASAREARFSPGFYISGFQP